MTWIIYGGTFLDRNVETFDSARAAVRRFRGLARYTATIAADGVDLDRDRNERSFSFTLAAPVWGDGPDVQGSVTLCRLADAPSWIQSEVAA